MAVAPLRSFRNRRICCISKHFFYAAKPTLDLLRKVNDAALTELEPARSLSNQVGADQQAPLRRPSLRMMQTSPGACIDAAADRVAAALADRPGAGEVEAVPQSHLGSREILRHRRQNHGQGHDRRTEQQDEPQGAQRADAEEWRTLVAGSGPILSQASFDQSPPLHRRPVPAAFHEAAKGSINADGKSGRARRQSRSIRNGINGASAGGIG